MKGLILAAGQGSRLRPLTDSLPKTLLPVTDEMTILDAALSNLSVSGVERIAIITGFASDKIESIVPALEGRHGVSLELIFNDKGQTWNNAYSLWLGAHWMDEDTIVINSDTLHPPSVETALIDTAAHEPDGLFIAVDTVKQLGEEEMKLTFTDHMHVRRIHKGINPAIAAGEYIGVTLLKEPSVADVMTSLRATWSRDTDLYYEDGYQDYIDRGERVIAVPIGDLPWVEVDSHDDLARARDIACLY
ncbi:MAG: phosphocholine cytidylyltransferase family protein [Actinomycetota bacterium]|nr:phosphocholine cytidylyltransferase family protein [Actinomycetota bacterium]